MTWKDEPYLDGKGFGYDLLKQVKEKIKVAIGLVVNSDNIWENLISLILIWKILVVLKLVKCTSSFIVQAQKNSIFLIDNL